MHYISMRNKNMRLIVKQTCLMYDGRYRNRICVGRTDVAILGLLTRPIYFNILMQGKLEYWMHHSAVVGIAH